ncbi:MAG: hypothetical protein ACI906_000503 [Candidatus Latescibacterota bacterium]|jgi:hypothetical protein
MQMILTISTRWHWLPIALALLVFDRPLCAAEDNGWDGRFALRWNMLTQSNSPSPDYQDLRGFLRLHSPRYSSRALQLHLDLDARQGLDENVTSDRGRFANRRRLRQAHIGADVAGGRLLLGRHRPIFGVLGAADTDGLSWHRSGSHWALALTGGYQVPYWQVNAPFSSDSVQTGGEIRWQPAGRSFSFGTALLRDEAFDGRSRWRSGIDERWRRGRLTQTLRAEFDPADNSWRSLRLDNSWRHSKKTQLRLSYAARLATVYPLSDIADSLLYGGRTHHFSLWLNQRWSRSLSTSFRLRSDYGDRPYRSEEVQLRWGQRRTLTLRLRDSWSPWRQLDQFGLLLQGRFGRRWSWGGGGDATLFSWKNARDGKLRLRARPQLHLSFAPGGNLSWRLRVEETIDEFMHLRTRAELSASYAL